MQSTRTVLEGFYFQNTPINTEPFSPSVDPVSNTPSGQSTNYQYTDSTTGKTFYFANDSGDNTTNDLNGIINRAADLSLNLTTFIKNHDALIAQSGDVYSKDILNTTGNPFIKNVNGLTEARKSDGQIMLVQQNTMYIIGIITTATILITAIMIAK